MPKHLAHQTSTHLLQHADQPVDWYPWGEEALARARAEDKPILLSIGYAACRWCHVMARESFSDPATAALMNQGFINIKVDREERPDIDQLYQLTHQLLRRRGGGWPLTVFLSPQGLPFYSGTYFPAVAQGGEGGPPAFADVLGTVSTVWADRREALAQQDAALLKALRAADPHPLPGLAPDPAVLAQQAQRELQMVFDAAHGGFGAAPKFPHPTDLAFLLRRGRDEGDEAALHMALFTLRQMAEGGLFDQVGGGFFRYSVDAPWRVPHFEKMLCDNAVLLGLYADALALTGEPLFRRVVEDTAGWALRELQAEGGGFCASLAAEDPQGQEGGFYVWEPEPLRLALSPNEWDVCAAHWGLVDPAGVDTAAGPRWHLRVARRVPDLARTLRRPEALVDELIASARLKLLAERAQRDAPARDDKQLTAWNALMVTGLVRAAQVAQRPDWLATARQTLGGLHRSRWQPGSAGQPGRLLSLPGQPAFLDDQAFLLDAVLALHAADPQPEDLPFAQALADSLLARFEDPAEGGFFFTPHDAPGLVHRLKPASDGPTPSGNGTAALALLALAERVDAPRYAEAAARCVRVFTGLLKADPVSHTSLLRAARVSASRA